MVADNLGDAVTPLPGAVELVLALAGTRPLAVTSNAPAAIIRHHLRTIGLLGAFDVILGCHDAPAPSRTRSVPSRVRPAGGPTSIGNGDLPTARGWAQAVQPGVPAHHRGGGSQLMRQLLRTGLVVALLVVLVLVGATVAGCLSPREP